MNWKLIFLLSLFGLAMGLLTVSVIPSTVEPFCWLAVFIISAIAIARNCGSRYFLHGFVTALFNCVWITAIEVIMYRTYMAHHPEMASAPKILPNHHRLTLVIMDGMIGIVSGLVLGLFAFIASKISRKKAVA